MALKVPGMVKTAFSASTLALQARTGESLKVRRVFIDAPSGTYAIFKIEKTTVGYFRVSPTYGNHLTFPVVLASNGATVVQRLDYNLLDELYAREIFTGYPVAEGETFYIELEGGATGTMCVVYDLYDAGDMKAEDMNGSKSREYFVINYGQPASAASTSGDILYSVSANPIEFPSFPFGDDVPAKTLVTIYGILGKEVWRQATSDSTKYYAWTRYLKLVKEREILFDMDRNGFLMYFGGCSATTDGYYYGGGQSQIGDLSTKSAKPPLYFDEPLVFAGGEELNIYVNVSVSGAAAALSPQSLEIGLIMKVSKE